MKSYKVYETTGHGAIAIEHGQRLYRLIHPHLLNGESLQLDFTGVEVLTDVFVGQSLGQLLRDIPAEKIKELIDFKGLDDDKYGMIQRTMNRAYRWYFNEQNQA
jgi:hypothetical protein